MTALLQRETQLARGMGLDNEHQMQRYSSDGCDLLNLNPSMGEPSLSHFARLASFAFLRKACSPVMHYAMHAGFTLFGAIHVAILCAVPVLTGVLSFAHRPFPAARNFIRPEFAAILLRHRGLLRMAVRHHSLTFPDHMPFELPSDCEGT